MNIQRVHVHDSSQGVHAGETGTVNVSSSLIRVSGAFSRALTADSAFGATPVLNARHVTAIGDGSADSHGADSHSAILTRTTTVNVRDSILRVRHALFREATDGTAHPAVSYSDYPTPASVDSNTAAPVATTPGPGNVDVDPAFIDRRRPATSACARTRLWSTPATPPPLGALDSPTDLGGLPRVADGNGDSAARSDIGPTSTSVPAPRPAARRYPLRPATPPGPCSRRPPCRAPCSAPARRARPVGARRKRAPRGTTVRFRLSEPAAVRLAIERRSTGRRITRRGKRVCVRRTRSNRSRRACVRYTGVRTLVRRGRAGRNAVSFTGRIRGRALTPGRYRMRLVATDAAGNRSTPRTLAFRIVR